MGAFYTVNPQGFDPVRTLCDDWVSINKRAVVGQNQKERARNEGERFGEHRGIAKAMSWFLTVRRVERYGKFDYVAAVDSYACEKFLQDFVTAHDETYGKLPANVNDEGYDDQKLQADLDFGVWYESALFNLCFPHDMEEREKERHQDAVLKGTETATVADVTWLEEMRDKHDAARASIEDIYAKIPTQD